MRKILLLCALLVMPLCCVFAQEQSNEDVNGIDLSHMAVVATVNIYDAKIVSQEGGDFVLSFDLSNREYVQPDIRYGVQLIKAEENGSQTIVDEFVFDENVALDEHQMIKKEVKYTAPDHLNGDFQMWIMAKNQAGLTLALANLDDVSLVGGGQSVEIDEASCFMRVNDQTTHYSLFQGVDIAQDEKISVVCDVNNRSNENIKIKPQTQTFWRSTFGKSVDTERVIYEEQGLDPLAKKQISIVLPKPAVPQAYDARVFFESEKGQMISNFVTAHYVLGGNSATIQNVRLDKNYYKKGENAQMSFFWSGAASNFMGARTAQDQRADLSVHIHVSDRDGVSCIDDFTQKIDPTITRPDFSLSIIRDCMDPHVVVEIHDAQDGVLDARTYDLTSDVPQGELKKQESRPLIFYGSIFIGVLFVVSLLIIVIKYKKGAMPVMLFMIFLPGIFLCGHMDVWADTFAGTYGARAQYPYLPYPVYAPHDYTVTANLSKSVYAPGESITGAITGITYSCINTLMDYSLIINIKGTNDTVNGSRNLGIEPKTHSVTTTAPTTPGMYNAYFTLRDNRCFPGVGICKFTSNNDLWLYLANKTAQVNAQNYEGRSDWSEDEVRQRIEAVSGTVYQHFLNFNASEKVWECDAACDSQDSAAHKWPIQYIVVGETAMPTPTCTGTLPAGATTCSGDNTGLTASVAWASVGTSSSSCTSTRKCEYYMPAVAVTTYSCTGGRPAGTLMCPDDNAGLNADTAWVDVGTEITGCTNRKCEYYGYECTGTTENGARRCPGTLIGLTADTPWTRAIGASGSGIYMADCTVGKKCEYFVPECVGKVPSGMIDCNCNVERDGSLRCRKPSLQDSTPYIYAGTTERSCRDVPNIVLGGKNQKAPCAYYGNACGLRARAYTVEQTYLNEQKFCNVGSAISSSGGDESDITFPDPGGSVSWTCDGNVTCTASGTSVPNGDAKHEKNNESGALIETRP